MEELFLGKIFLKIDIVGDSIRFLRNDGYIFIMKHEQDCCESVYIEDINGDLNDLIGSPMLIADESFGSNDKEEGVVDESFTWTFYRFATIKGYVDIRWYGSSNGYYSESVDVYIDGIDISLARDIKIDNIL